MSNEDGTETEEGNDEACIVEEVKDSVRDKRNMMLLNEYVKQMTYRPCEIKPVCAHTERLSKPKPRTVAHTYEHFRHVLTPPERRARLKRMNKNLITVSPEQFAKILKKKRAQEKALEKRQLRKQDVYYELLQKLESQCRSQYLNVMIKKFAEFISKLATTMRIPPQLVDPYARMHRGIYCNILNAIGLKPINDPCINRCPELLTKYEVANKLAHALLSLIIKALDEATSQDPKDICVEPVEDGPWDKYIKDRLMIAAAKKCRNEDNHKKKTEANKFAELMRKCHNFDECFEYL